MAGTPDAPSPIFFGKSSAKRPKRSPAKALKRYHSNLEALIFKPLQRDCRKSPKMAILAISHVMKSTGYEHQNHRFRVFRQFQQISTKKGQPLQLPSHAFNDEPNRYLLNFFLTLKRPIKPQAKKSMSAIVDTGPSFRASQLTPMRGNRLRRTMNLKVYPELYHKKKPLKGPTFRGPWKEDNEHWHIMFAYFQYNTTM